VFLLGMCLVHPPSMHPPYTHTPDLASAVLDVHDVNDSVHTGTFTIQYFHSFADAPFQFADAHFSVRGRSLFSSRTLAHSLMYAGMILFSTIIMGCVYFITRVR
jgi:hypothetical protein